MTDRDAQPPHELTPHQAYLYGQEDRTSDVPWYDNPMPTEELRYAWWHGWHGTYPEMYAA